MRVQCLVVRVIAIAALTVAIASGVACGGGGPSYQLAVAFNSSVTQADMDKVQRLVRSYDSGAEMLVTETFPPTGHVVVKTGTPDFCRKIDAALDALPSVANVSCERLDGGSDGGG